MSWLSQLNDFYACDILLKSAVLSCILCLMRLDFVWTDDNPDNFKDTVRRLPKSLTESVEALEIDAVLRDLIGEKLLVAITGIRKVLKFMFSLWMHKICDQPCKYFPFLLFNWSWYLTFFQKIWNTYILCIWEKFPVFTI